jgi:hypothetical protein
MDKSEHHETSESLGNSYANHGSERRLTAGQAIRAIQRIGGISISRSTLWRWHMDGRLGGIRVGRRLFTTEMNIRALLEKDQLISATTVAERGTAAAERLRINERKHSNGSEDNLR